MINLMPHTQAYLFKRYLWLLETIAFYGPISYPDIAELWEKSSLNDGNATLPHKTFENHRKATEELFGVEIICDRRTNLYSIEKDDVVDFRPETEMLLESLMLTNELSDSPTLRKAVAFEKIPAGMRFITPILRCIRSGYAARIIYTHEYMSDKTNTYTVIPIGMKLYKRRWYLITVNTDGTHPYSYALDRLVDINPVKNITKVATPDLNTLFDDCYGIIRDPEWGVEDILLKVSKYQAMYLEALPLHHTQQVVKRTDSHVWFSLRLRPAYDFIMELLANGKDVEVIKPDSLRKKIASEIDAMKSLYN